ncbi:hypothetical protein [Paenibacillus sp. OSY-SE]|nr:hypothetical protein [Paenibacillus sp. OSY-SE]
MRRSLYLFTSEVSSMAVSWVVTGLGVVVSLLGYYLSPSAWGYGILGFGLAHIVLGVLDMFRMPERSRY